MINIVRMTVVKNGICTFMVCLESVHGEYCKGRSVGHKPECLVKETDYCWAPVHRLKQTLASLPVVSFSIA